MQGAYIYKAGARNNRAFAVQLECFVGEAKKAGVALYPVDGNQALAFLSQNLPSFDFAYLGYPDLPLSVALEAMGLHVYNNSQAAVIASDRVLAYFLLTGDDLPLPRYVASPDPGGYPFSAYFESLGAEMKDAGIVYPCVAEERDGSSSVTLLSSLAFFQYLKKRRGQPFYIREAFSGPRLVAYVVGSSCLTIFEKKRKVDPLSPSQALTDFLYETEANTRFTRALAVEAVKQLGWGYGMVELDFVGKTPIVVGVNPYLRTVAAEHLSKLPITCTLMRYLAEHAKIKDIYYSDDEMKRMKKVRLSNEILESRRIKK